MVVWICLILDGVVNKNVGNEASHAEKIYMTNIVMGEKHNYMVKEPQILRLLYRICDISLHH